MFANVETNDKVSTTKVQEIGLKNQFDNNNNNNNNKTSGGNK